MMKNLYNLLSKHYPIFHIITTIILFSFVMFVPKLVFAQNISDDNFNTIAGIFTIIALPTMIIIAFRNKIFEKINYSRFNIQLPRDFSFFSELYNKSKPVKIKSSKTIGTHSEYRGLEVLEINLNKKPDNTWINFYHHPESYRLGRDLGEVNGRKIICNSLEHEISKTVDEIENYIIQVNERYDEKVQELKREYDKEKEKERKNKEREKEINKKLKDKK